MEWLMRLLVGSLVAAYCLALGQTQLPLDLQGVGSLQTEPFTLDGPFSIDISATGGVYTFLYDKATNENVATLSRGEVFNLKGEFSLRGQKFKAGIEANFSRGVAR